MMEEKIKKQIIKKYKNGISVNILSKEYDVARSSIYHWIQEYQPIPIEKLSISKRELYLLKKENETLKKMIKIYEKTQCVQSSPLKMKLEAMEKVEKEFSHNLLCKTLNVKKGTFLNHLYRKKEITQTQEQDNIFKKYILELFNLHNGRIGSKKISGLLKNQGISCSQKRVKRLMNELNLEVKRTERATKKIVHRISNNSTLPNTLKREFYPKHPNKVWACDFTQFNTNYINKYYICVILDLFSRKVISYGLSHVCTTDFLEFVFDTAISKRCPNKNLIFHGDQGAQFTSIEFMNKLKKLNIIQSFSAPGVPYDNAVIESFFSSLKREALYVDDINNLEELIKSLDNYITYYNCLRPHNTLNYMSPNQYEKEYYSKENQGIK